METVATGSDEEYVKFTRKEVFLVVKDRLEAGSGAMIPYLEEEISKKSGQPSQLREDTRASLSILFGEMGTRWRTANRTESTFFNRNKEWLDSPLFFPVPLTSPDGHRADPDSPSNSQRRGRLSSDSEPLCERLKRRRTEQLPETLDPQESSDASWSSPSSTGQIVTTKFIYVTTLTLEAALSFFVERKLSISQYKALRLTCKEYDCELYPPYRELSLLADNCYPPRTTITIGENSAQVELQALLDHTADQILGIQDDLIRSWPPAKIIRTQLVGKWGYDERPGQSEREGTSEDDSRSYANGFCVSVVPLKLVAEDPKSKEEILIWKNPRPSSLRFCRLVSLKFAQKSTESATSEVQRIEEQIKSLVPFEDTMCGKQISVTYKMSFTKIDDQACKASRSTESAPVCRLCESHDSKDEDDVRQQGVQPENLDFGLSTLYLWTQFFECCLDLSYKLGVKKCQASGAEEEEAVESRKKIVRAGFASELGLLVDRPKSEYDGDAARRFFRHAETSALVTAVDQDLIERFRDILQAIAIERDIDADSFGNYTLETARKFVELYPWYRMPFTVHMLLFHGPRIVADGLLPMGQLFEEAREARHVSKKSSPARKMKELFYRLLVTSDPYISGFRRLPLKISKSLSDEAADLLVYPEIIITPVSSADWDIYSDDVDSGTDSDC